MRTLKCRRGTCEISSLGKDEAEATRGCGVAAHVGQPVGLFRARKVTTVLQQRAEMERGVRFAALVRAVVARLRLVQLAALFEQQAKVDR